MVRLPRFAMASRGVSGDSARATSAMESLTVIKAGTGVLTRASDGTLDGASLVRLVTAIAGLVESGHRCLLVSSGAVGAGVSAFGLGGYPSDLTTKQACA